MTLLHAVILAMVEGITEFLPISSTGHMILVARIFAIPQTEFVKSYEIIIQLGAILAVGVLYVKTLLTNQKLWKPLIFAFLPTAIVGFTLYPLIKSVLLGNDILTALSLFVGGIVLIAFEKYFKTQKSIMASALTPKDAVTIGLFQAISIIPGVSRSAASILGGMISGLSRKDAVEFSFLLALPTMLAATGLDVLKNYEVILAGNLGILLLGSVIAFVTAWISVKKFLSYVSNKSLANFGVYRIIVALLFFLFVVVSR
jgi:undecaprenyl-diphosphatase